MHSLTDKRVLITGGGSGIGRSLALRFAREGAELHVADLDLAAAGSRRASRSRRPGDERGRGSWTSPMRARSQTSAAESWRSRVPSTSSSTTPGSSTAARSSRSRSSATWRPSR